MRKSAKGKDKQGSVKESGDHVGMPNSRVDKRPKDENDKRDCASDSKHEGAICCALISPSNSRNAQVWSGFRIEPFGAHESSRHGGSSSRSVTFFKLMSSNVDIVDVRLHMYDYAVNLSQQTKILAGSMAGFLPLGVVVDLAAKIMAVYAYAYYNHL